MCGVGDVEDNIDVGEVLDDAMKFCSFEMVSALFIYCFCFDNNFERK